MNDAPAVRGQRRERYDESIETGAPVGRRCRRADGLLSEHGATFGRRTVHRKRSFANIWVGKQRQGFELLALGKYPASAPHQGLANSGGTRETWFVGDSPLEGDGFEPSVPLAKSRVLGLSSRGIR